MTCRVFIPYFLLEIGNWDSEVPVFSLTPPPRVMVTRGYREDGVRHWASQQPQQQEPKQQQQSTPQPTPINHTQSHQQSTTIPTTNNTNIHNTNNTNNTNIPITATPTPYPYPSLIPSALIPSALPTTRASPRPIPTQRTHTASDSDRPAHRLALVVLKTCTGFAHP
jgi:hypothetical protein